MTYENLNIEEKTKILPHLKRILIAWKEMQKIDEQKTAPDFIKSIEASVKQLETAIKSYKKPNMLHPTQKKIMFYIQRYVSTNRRSPTVAEIRENILDNAGKSLSTNAVVTHHLKQLEKMQYIKLSPRIARGIEILETIEL